MTRKNLISFRIQFLIIGILCMFISSFAQSSVTMEGIIESHITEEDGTPIMASLSVEEVDEEGDTVNRSFIIENNKKGKELLAHMGEFVYVKGTVRKDKEENDVLTVLEYTLSDDEPDDDEYESEDYE